MKLIYRGNTYDYDPTQASPDNAGRPVKSAPRLQAPYTLMYRGATYHVDPTVPQPQSSHPRSYDLIYRGATYHVDRDAQGNLTALTHSAAASRSKSAARASQRELSQLHQANLANNLQRRLQVAQERGDQRLLDLLEAERQQITMSH
ncbi:MAG: DUF4278 domain-containing protein [Phormidesmis sp. CAN_BIN44]|nr:DUF4278 domain-containing protein [Phormidesmis sp. CAN_BIN44]